MKPLNYYPDPPPAASVASLASLNMAPKKCSFVEQAFLQVENSLRGLEDDIELLCVRLQSYTSKQPPPSNNDTPNVAPLAGSSDAVMQLDGLVRKICLMRAVVASLQERLEL